MSVIIPTHNPRVEFLEETLSALRKQDLRMDWWELVIVDNSSKTPVRDQIDATWHPRTRFVTESELGLTYARLAGFREAIGEIVVMVDDDNVLDADYLSRTLELSELYPFIGSWSGDLRPRYEDPALALPDAWENLICIRRIASVCYSNDMRHHASTPWGAGMGIRRRVIQGYVDDLNANPMRRSLDLIGSNRIYGGDTDIAFAGCRMGFAKAVFPQLRLQHIIPKERCSIEYLQKVAHGYAYSSELHQFLLGMEPESGRNGIATYLLYCLRGLRMNGAERKLRNAREKGKKEGQLAVRNLQAFLAKHAPQR